MTRLTFVLLVLLLGACGGSPSRQPYQKLPSGYTSIDEAIKAMRSSLKLDEEYTTIDKKQYPDLYKALVKSDYRKVYELLGAYPGSQVITSGDDTLVGIKTMRDGKKSTLDDLLYYAMKKGKMDRVQELLSGGADPNSLNSGGHSALHVLYAKGYKIHRRDKLADMLISRGADPNLKTRDGENLLHLALGSDIDDKMGAIEYLISRGVNPDLRSVSGKTALQAVFDSDMRGKREAIEYLLSHGADPNMEDTSGSTLLQTVFDSDMEGKPELIVYLMAHGADPNYRDKYGNTVLHKALLPKLRYIDGLSDEEIISWIGPVIERGADLDARNLSGLTALSYAKGEIEAYLLNKGAKDYGEYAWGSAQSPEWLPADNILGMNSFDMLGLSKEACHKLLREYGVKFKALEEIENVEMPVRLNSGVGGISYTHKDGSKKFSIMDCRIVAALVGWAPVLRKHNVTEVVHMRAYSPGARVGNGSKVSGHDYALALDAAQFVFKDGSALVVNDDWSDRRHRAEPCEAPEGGDSDTQAELRNIACETGNAGVFSMILTPHYNRAHYDHLHLEVTDEVAGYVR